jgi:hypothetical protein
MPFGSQQATIHLEMEKRGRYFLNRRMNLGLFFVVIVSVFYPISPKSVSAQTRSEMGAVASQIFCKQIEGTLCIDSANNQGWSGTDFGEHLTSAIGSLPTYNGYSRGVVWVKNDTYLMTTPVTITSPYVVIRCEAGAVIDYQGAGVAFTVNPVPFIYEGNGGFENCKLTNSTNNWTAGIKIEDANFIHLYNTLIVGSGTGSQSCLLFDSHAHYNEQTDLMHVSLSKCAVPLQFQVTGGTGSFAYTRFRDVELNVPVGSSGAGILLLNNTQLHGSDLEFNVFLPQGGVGLWFRNTSQFVLARLRFQCEGNIGVTNATCLKTDPGTQLQAMYSEAAVDPSVVSDSIAPGTLIPYAWNYFYSGLSSGEATSSGILLIPNGTNAGYACGASCGAVNFDTNTQLPGTYPHIQPPANLGNGTWTIALEQLPNKFTQTFTDTGFIRSSVVTADQGAPCSNAELKLSSGWGSAATVTGVIGTGQTCEWTITSNGTGQAANPTILDVLTNPMPTDSVVCDMRMVGGTGASTLIDQVQVSATTPRFSFAGTPVAGATYKVVRRCGP